MSTLNSTVLILPSITRPPVTTFPASHACAHASYLSLPPPPQDDEEISFAKGDRIKLLEKVEEHWWEGELLGGPRRVSMAGLNANIGFFPVLYVKQVVVAGGSGAAAAGGGEDGDESKEDGARWPPQQGGRRTSLEDVVQEAKVIRAAAEKAELKKEKKRQQSVMAQPSSSLPAAASSTSQLPHAPSAVEEADAAWAAQRRCAYEKEPASLVGQHVELAHGGHGKSMALVVDVVRRRGMPTEHLLRFADVSDAALLQGETGAGAQDSVSVLLERHGNGGVAFEILNTATAARAGRSSVVERVEGERRRILEEELALGKQGGSTHVSAPVMGSGKRKQSAKLLEGWRVNIPGMVSDCGLDQQAFAQLANTYLPAPIFACYLCLSQGEGVVVDTDKALGRQTEHTILFDNGKTITTVLQRHNNGGKEFELLGQAKEFDVEADARRRATVAAASPGKLTLGALRTDSSQVVDPRSGRSFQF